LQQASEETGRFGAERFWNLEDVATALGGADGCDAIVIPRGQQIDGKQCRRNLVKVAVEGRSSGKIGGNPN
jgi:hypothetical protein